MSREFPAEQPRRLHDKHIVSASLRFALLRRPFSVQRKRIMIRLAVSISTTKVVTGSHAADTPISPLTKTTGVITPLPAATSSSAGNVRLQQYALKSKFTFRPCS